VSRGESSLACDEIVAHSCGENVVGGSLIKVDIFFLQIFQICVMMFTR